MNEKRSFTAVRLTGVLAVIILVGATFLGVASHFGSLFGILAAALVGVVAWILLRRVAQTKLPKA
jgi:hypothetical protein